MIQIKNASMKSTFELHTEYQKELKTYIERFIAAFGYAPMHPDHPSFKMLNEKQQEGSAEFWNNKRVIKVQALLNMYFNAYADMRKAA